MEFLFIDNDLYTIFQFCLDMFVDHNNNEKHSVHCCDGTKNETRNNNDYLDIHRIENSNSNVNTDQ